MQVKPQHAAAAALLLVAGGLAYLATRTAGNVQMPQYTEVVRGPLQVQVLSVDELHMSRTFTEPNWPMHYPGRVAAGVSQLIARGWAPFWQPANPQVAALPAEVRA